MCARSEILTVKSERCCFKARWLLDHVRVSFDLMRDGYLFPHESVLSLVTDKQVSPKSGTLKSPPKGFDTSAISKTYYNLVRIRSAVIVFSCFSCLHHIHVETFAFFCFSFVF